MKVGIDSYSYHRAFGEVFPIQAPAARRMSIEEFLQRAHALGAEGVSLESCFLPSFAEGYLRELKSRLDEYHLERVLAWGHPRGLEAGKSAQAFHAMLAAFRHAQIIGAGTMRVVSGNRVFRQEPHAPQLARLKEMYREAVKVARDYDIRMAIENHLDYDSAELMEILSSVDSPYLGINIDTGNFFRLSEDPAEAVERLAPFVFAAHIKDLRVTPGVAPDQWYYYTTVPVGEGIVDNLSVLRSLERVGYRGLLAIEVDLMHPDYADEDAVIERSIQNLRQMVEKVQNPK